MSTPHPSAAFPAVDPARDLPAAVALIRRVAAERHPYDGVLLGMAADVLEAASAPVSEAEIRAAYEARWRIVHGALCKVGRAWGKNRFINEGTVACRVLSDLDALQSPVPQAESESYSPDNPPPHEPLHSCPCGSGDEPCPGADGRPLCDPAAPPAPGGES